FQGDEYFNYGFPTGHPLTSKRYWATLRKMEERGIFERENVVRVEAKSVSEEILRLFHSEDHIELVRDLSSVGRGYLDYGDTPAYKGVFEASMASVGASVKAVDSIMKEEAVHSQCIAGGLHHASRDRSAGFCVFNDVAVAITYLLEVIGIERILYVDIDAHFGDGVFYSFNEDSRVWIGDVHQRGDTLYPGTGWEWETGEGAAVDTKLNIPLRPGASDDELIEGINKIVEHGERAFPQIILMQTGTDGLINDPLTNLRYTLEGHLEAVKRVHSLADRVCSGKMAVFGGGGYDVEGTSDAWTNILDFLS
ncbi:MAG: acetoin utilization protein AcuC, partial [Nitrososphaeria archaeon]|nr:acetoin utilization protein AcuC [Nitrososphaeria archaeon]NIN51772.1 acetoin utilization protein AcuC [Nitrososphaeria archaeon]NIQ32277.1 acetoin utilization protein AcuC [Nitrososphaeria archaeon]